MVTWFVGLDPVWQATLAGLFTWAMTALGSSIVFFFNELNQKLLDIMNSFSAGVMIAASFWSLLLPSINYAEDARYGIWSFLPAVVGIVAGTVFLKIIDKTVPHMPFYKERNESRGREVNGLSSADLLFLSLTIHNIPDGLAMGVAFGAIGAANLGNTATLASAIAITLGIGLQNLPEGAAVSMPIRAGGSSKWHAFNLGQASALVEIGSATLGALLVTKIIIITPYALAFAAGAMIFVSIEELIPKSQSNGNSDIATLSFIVGFVVMMTLDVILG